MNEIPSTYVPSHWQLEIANGILMAERRNRISRTEAAEAFDIARTLPVITDDLTVARSGRETAALARQYGLTIYDAAYLELAMRQGSGLATLDKALSKAAASAGVTLLL